MKITKLIAIALFLSITSLSAQEIANHSIGLRLGDSDGFGAEISYQKSIGRYNRAELNFGYRDSREYDGIKAVLVLQWIHNIDGGLNWTMALGVALVMPILKLDLIRAIQTIYFNLKEGFLFWEQVM